MSSLRLGGGGPAPRYDAFLSYSSRDADVAGMLHGSIQQIGNPPWRRRAHRIFRDDASLHGTERLWEGLQEALDRSDHFVLLASPASAEAEWVRRELEHFLDSRERDHQELLVVLVDGTFTWNRELDRLDVDHTTAFPTSLADRLDSEPLYLDLTAFRRPSDRRERRNRLRSVAAAIAAVIRDQDKDDVIGDHISRQRRNLAFLGAVAIALALLVVVAWTQQQRAEAEELRQRAEAISSLALSVEEVDRALLVAVAGDATDRSPNTVRHLMDVLVDAGRVERFVHDHDAAVRTVAASADGSVVVTADEDGEVIVRDDHLAPIGDPIATDGGSIRDIAVFADRAEALLASDDGSISLLDLSEPAIVDRIDVSDLQVRAVAIAPDGERVYVGTWDGSVVVLDGELRLVGNLAVDIERIHSVAVSSDGAHLVVGGRVDGRGRGRVVIHALSDGSQLALADAVGTVENAAERLRTVSSVAVDPGAPGTVYFGSFSGVVARWDFDGDGGPRQLGRHDEQIARIRVDPGSSADDVEARVVATSFDGSIRVWSSLGRAMTESMSHHGPRVWDAVFVDDGRRLVTAGDTGSIALVDSRSPAPPVTRLVAEVGSPSLLVVPGPAGSERLVSIEDADIVVRDAGSLAEVARHAGGVGTIGALAPLPANDGEVLVGGVDGEVRRVDLGSGVGRLVASTPMRVSALAVHPSSGVVAIGGSLDEEGVVEFHHLTDGDADVPPPLTGLDDASLLGASFAANGEVLVLGGSFRHETMLTWPDLTPLDAAGSPVRITSAVPVDGTGWALATDDQDVELTTLGGRELTRLAGSGDVVTAVAHSPVTQLLAAASADGTVRLWELRGRAAPFSPIAQAHRSLVRSLAFSVDGSRLYSASRTELLVWDLDPDALAARACGVASRALEPAEWADLTGDDDPPDVC